MLGILSYIKNLFISNTNNTSEHKTLDVEQNMSSECDILFTDQNNDIMHDCVKIWATSICASFIGFAFGIDMSLTQEFIMLLNGTFIFYMLFYNAMNTYYKPFAEIKPAHKKMYVIKNLTKSLMLANLAMMIPANIYNIITDKSDLMFMKQCAMHYVINDIIGLLIVRKLPRTTIIHHLTTTTFAFLTQLKQTNELDIITLIEIYAMFSAMAFCVNFYLGMRILPLNIHIKKILSITSLIVYSSTCLVNWIIQFYFVYKLFFIYPTQVLLYIFFFMAVARDDVILMTWLKNDVQK